MFELDLRSRKPIYEQLVERFKVLIINEVMSENEQLPSVRTLAGELTINPNTIQKAYRELEVQGYIYSVKGRGSFVNEAAQIGNADKLNKVKADLQKLIAEGIYLGITSDELISMIKEIEGSAGGGLNDDTTS
jgi:GntR family transcriptional regulator